jgi:alkaline phosphatase D
MAVTRRALLGLISGSTFFLSARGLSGETRLPATAPGLRFDQGVASGDPQPGAVMLWTRAAPVPDHAAGGDVPVVLQVSRGEDFTDLVLQELLHTGAGSDFTLRAYVEGLQPDTIYFYRFLGGEDSRSRTGRTRTAPAPHQPRRVNLAFASCQNFEDAYYGSWARMIADDKAAPDDEAIDFVLHLGDFIYERIWDRRSSGLPHSRKLAPLPDGEDSGKQRHAVTLADYRHLYRSYLEDPHLQEARARWPFVCTWDDHEFSNDNFQSFSTYGETSRLEPQRRLDANQAWFEYIPCVLSELQDQPAHDFRQQPLTGDAQQQNLAATGSLRIYRQLRWGRHLDLLVTDSRSYRSAPCLPGGFAESLGLPMNTVRLVDIADSGRDYDAGNPPEFLPYGDGSVPNPARDRDPGSMLGAEQRAWFLAALQDSSARWKLWGNALPLIPMRLDLSTLPFTGYEDSIFAIDAWAGYPHELGLIMRHLEQQGISGVVSLSGDHHMHGAGGIRRSTTDVDARAVCVDFTVASISSTPIFEDLAVVARNDHPDFQPIVYREEDGGITPVWNMSMLRGVFAAYTYSKTGLQVLAEWLGPNNANPDLKYVDTTANGYGLAQFDEDALRVQLVTVAHSRQPFETPPEIEHRAHFVVPWWSSSEQPEIQGPVFDGGAPFPFKPPSV